MKSSQWKLVYHRQTPSFPLFLYSDVFNRERVWSTNYPVLCKATELGGSLICSYHGNDVVHVAHATALNWMGGVVEPSHSNDR